MDERGFDKREQTRTTKEGLAKSGILIACIIFFLALTIRFIYLYESSANPSFQSPIVDSAFYDSIARRFADGQGLAKQIFGQPFFYPFFLSVVYFLSGNSIIFAKVIQVLLGGLTCVLTYKLAEVIFDRRIGIIAGLITVFYGPVFFSEGELLATGWASLWAVVVILLFLKTKEKNKTWQWFLLGLCGALSIITRPEFFPFFFAGCIWLMLRTQRGLSLVSRFGAILVGIALVAVPVGAAAKYAVGRFSILPILGGVNLYIGNNPDYCQTVKIRPGEEFEDMTRIAWRHGARTVKGQDRFFKQQVIEYAKNQPLNFAKGLERKTLEFICSREIPRSVSVYVLGKWSRLLRLLTWKADGFGFPFGLIFPLTALGVIFNWRRIPAPVILFIVLYPLSVILVFVASRFRVPMVPVFAILAAAGLVSVVEKIRLKRWRELILIAIVIVGAVLLSTLPGPFCQEQVDFETEFFRLVGFSKSEQGLNDEAMACFSEALRLKPDCHQTHFYIGAALTKQGRISEAIRYYREALRLKPDYPLVHANLGIVLLGQGKVDEAIEHYKEALRLQPDFPAMHYYLGIAFELQGKVDKAIEHYKEALRRKPDFPEARENLASALERRGKSK